MIIFLVNGEIFPGSFTTVRSMNQAIKNEKEKVRKMRADETHTGKVIIDKSCGGVSLVVQNTIELCF